ncbi:MAG TPA: glutamate 5-kinase [Candidatus Merdivicinus intestinigallinarum]|nr:glutamate 5-kinase [Candidatus Merdivicinus intestinigallinarum]
MIQNVTQANRIVVKVGTSTLAHKTGLMNIQRMERLVKVLADLKNSGKEIILVSSGAIGVGVGKMGLKEKPTDTPAKQACAAIGQCELMYCYDKYFSEYNHSVAQVLLTRDIIDSPERKQNVVNTFQNLLHYGVVPVVNENDTVAVEEIVFGDNDTLSAIVGSLVGADLLIILSDIDGVYDQNPRVNPNAKLIPHIPEITDSIRALAGDHGTSLGTGGMVTKITAAQIGLNAGFPTVILNGSRPENLYDLLEGKQVGTYIG